jgi:glycosyltransferase involved in cell wall biosynthesis
MKIVIDGRMILPYMTGVGRYILGLLPALLRTGPELELELLLQKDLPVEHVVRNLTEERLHLEFLAIPHMNLRSQWIIPYALARSRSDLFHYPHFDLPWFTPGPIVSTIHDLKYIARPDYFVHRGRSRRLTIRLMMIHTCRRSYRVIVDSNSTAQDLSHYLGVTSSKIRSIPLGLDRRFSQDIPPPVLERFRRKYALDHPYLLFVGERRPHKNLVGLIEAFALFRRMVNQPYQLVIVGKRYSDYQVPEQVALKRDLVNQVRFIDYLPDEDLPALYRSADAFVLLSFYEGFGLPVLEAMASGIAVVASDRTSLPEVVGEAALLVSPDDPEQVALSLRQVIPGGELREPCIAAGLEHARGFTWERCARLTLDVYREALAS